LYHGETVPGTSDSDLESNQSDPYDLVVLEGFSQLDPTSHQPFDFDLFTSTDIALPGTEAYGSAVNWEYWNEFILDTGAVSADLALNTFMVWPLQMLVTEIRMTSHGRVTYDKDE